MGPVQAEARDGRLRYTKREREKAADAAGTTATEYSVISSRVGNPQTWGFHGGPHNLQTSNIDDLSNRTSPFLNNELTAAERKSLTACTGGIYRDINAAVTGRDKHPASSIATHVSRIESAFGKLAVS